ncbi:MAG TPA: UDP-glucose/GDP-mannose dehydrogenase family protein [Thermoplasmata archaeon]|nr:UDP-glucose/GDP-mannose dehydrogenase family protein [Thermoplasmata archaeon]
MRRSTRTPSGLRVGVVGLGYMGLPTALSLAARGHRVVGYDLDPSIRRELQRSHSPYREPRLEELLGRMRHGGRFRLVDDIPALITEVEGVFVCLPTPPGPSGRIDLRPLTSGLRSLGAALRPVTEFRVAVIKSTVVPGTTEGVLEPLLRRTSGRTIHQLGVASNPEFLAEGSMVRDALRPERIVLGSRDRRTRDWLRRLYHPFHAPLYEMSPTGAELVKYASNAFLALKVSFANEISRMAEGLGVHVDEVLAAVGADSRIGPKFLKAGPGFGGSCFSKDLRAIVSTARDLGLRFRLGETTLLVNDEQTGHALALIRNAVGPVRDRNIAVLGLSFKAGTDDVRESRAFPLVEALVNGGARTRVHDPVALPRFRAAWENGDGARRPGGGRLEYSRTVRAALEGADAAVLLTDWPVYHGWTKAWTERMAGGVLVDLRRALSPAAARRANLRLVALGVGEPTPVSAPVGQGGLVPPGGGQR